MTLRRVKALHSAVRDDIGDLVTRRPLPSHSLRQIDPFLLLNHHGPQVYPRGNDGLPFGPHPHRGFETVTFIVEGELAHVDSAGHESVIRGGGVQWMTAGNGIVHAEVSPRSFMEQGGPLEILQLWINLPARLKMVAPRYIGLQAAQVPIVSVERATLHLVSGAYHDVHGPVESLTGVFMSTVELAPNGRLQLNGIDGRNVLLYVVRGAAEVASARAPAFTLVELEPEGDLLEVRAETGALLIVGHAKPIHEPVVAHGPFVMNTHEEIQAAIRDYQAGRFGNVAA